ncbi:WASH complex subunit 2A isoform X2 [Hemibagrus wyckioides]|uniref:WASH complex subunit 2A isoform X2 n=1 Tax=Hemibagrus wyckioides TaxID=337641 RepID=UPI00266BE0C2|nr:WASH complex subunit 2A isoform X2 [Hemibagrus wyckioides]
MAEPMENGPSNCNGEAEQVWERPWTLDEMRKNSANWSLAADSGLFLYLQNFSQRMLSKTHEIEKQLDGLIRDTKATDSCLHTVFNDFLMLSNIQFIENRVYDEEVEEPVPKTETQERRPEQEKTREQKEAELIPKVQEAVTYGLKVLESAFEQLDIKVGNSDSEDEEAADRVEPILEPKDLYVDRPLPYLIGSQAFMEQDDVGLGDLSSDEMSIDSDRESFVESDVDKDQEEHSDEDFDQEGEIQGRLKNKAVSSDEEEENEDSDLFGESDKDDDEARRDDVGPASFADQLAARIKDAKKPEADRTSLSSGTSVTKRKKQGKKLPEAQVEEEDDEMFKPPKMEDDEYSPFGGKGGLFSGGKGLFDDEEGDLFSEAPKKEKEQGASQKTERVNTKKIPTGAVSIFPENNLFGSPNGSDSLESKENDSPVKSKVQAAREQTSLGSGLFGDNEDDDDFFSGKTLKKPTSAAQEKVKPKTTADLFGSDEDDDEDGDIFSVGSRSAISQQSKKVAEEEEVVQPPEKKLPAGAISMFGAGTNSLLAESLKKRHPSTSEDSVKSEESVPPPVVKPSVAPKTTEKVQSKSLFSDDEDSQIFPTVPKSQSKPEGPAQNKPNKATISIFDDDEEEDLFSSMPKSQSVQVKTAVSQPKKTLSSALFSDDEDQWMSAQPSPAKSDVKSGGMKSSTSAPSRLPSAKAPQKDSLFDDDDDDDLFAATKEPSQKKPQRVSLLFEDEEDEDKGSLFGFKPSANKGTPEAKVPAAASQAPSLFGPEETQEVVNVAEVKPSDKKVVQAASSPEETNKTKKPAGAVSLFGGINVLGDEAKTTTKPNKNAVEDFDDLDWHKEAPPPMETKEKKATKNTFSLFDDDDEEEEEPDEIPPLSTATKQADKSTLKSQEPKASVKSTGVFQDEELLFSHTQQRDNDPEVDLFATTAKPSTTVQSSVKPAVSGLFGEDDDDDDLFGSAKPKAPPKVPEKPSKAKLEETDKGASKVPSAKSEASLAINPASLMPGAGPRLSGAGSITPDLAQSSSPRPAGLLPASSSTAGVQAAAEGGISFDSPAQVTTLQNANKDRIKGATQRRPQTRAARRLAAQHSEEAHLEENSALQAASAPGTTSAPSAFNPVPARPSALTLPISTNTTTMPAQTLTDGAVRPKILPAAEEDLFSSEDLFASASVPKQAPPPQTKTKAPETVLHGASKKKEPALPIFDDHSEDLFATVKPKPVKKSKAMPFLDDDDDLFGAEKKKDPKTTASSVKPDIFQDDNETPSKVLKKPKEQSLEASLFDDDVDIFADLTPTTKPKEKKAKKKVETKSIFDDDMDDIFSSGITKPVGASTAKKSKKPVQENNSAEESGHSIFDDPLNVFGGN